MSRVAAVLPGVRAVTSAACLLRLPAGRGDTVTHHQGMADVGRERIAGMVLGAWDAFLDQAAAVDLDRRSRLPGWRAQEICVHLGLWPENTALADLIASAPPPPARPAP